MPSELPPDVLNILGGVEPKTEFDTTDLNRVQKVNANPVGVPLHHSKIEADRPVETNGISVRGLADDRAWFFLGFVYEFIPLEIDLLEVFYAAGNLHRDVQNVVVPDTFIGRKDTKDFPLMHLLQGIPKAVAPRFIDFLTTYRFHRPGRQVQGRDLPDQDWCVNFSEIRMADPTVTHRRAVDVWFALPVSITEKCQVGLHRPPGFLLDMPVFGIVKTKEPDAS